jgi:tetratricopeptide (TPR) repeat protein
MRRRCGPSAYARLALAALLLTAAAASAHAEAEAEANADAKPEADVETEAESPDPLADAQRQLEAGRLYPAERSARTAIERHPDSAEAHLVLGRILIGRTRFEAAERALSRAAELDPELPGVDRALGRVRFELEDCDGALDPLERALERDPDDAELWMQLGLCALERGDPERAAAAFERAARDPAWAGLAQYDLGVAREAMGAHAESRAAFRQALASGLPTTIAERATSRLATAPESEPERRFSLSAAAGTFFESEVAQPESDQIDRDPDGVAQFELGGAWEPRLGETRGRLGYDFYQKLYFTTKDFDLQSHTFSARLNRRFGPVSSSLGYVYSLNLLGDSLDRFLDFQEVRWTNGLSLTGSWYASLSPGLRIKRFDRPQDAERDGVGPVVGLLQLFPLGDWSRYLLLGIGYAYDDAKAEFDRHEIRAQLALHLPFTIAGRECPLDLRYLFELRDYVNDASLAGPGSREDIENAARVRWAVPLMGPIALQTEYEFQDVDSQLASADRTVHRVGLRLMLEY